MQTITDVIDRPKDEITWLVIQDLVSRARRGVEKYTTTLEENNSDDYIISTGETFHITKFLEYSFQRFNLHWQDHVALTQELQRPSDITINATDPTKIALEIGWTADNNMYGVIDRMAEALEYPKSNLFNLALNLPVINSDFIGCHTATSWGIQIHWGF